jgi:hypothetical protein
MASTIKSEEQKDFHPLKVIEGVTNVTGYKSRKTHYLTIPARLTQQVGYIFNPKEKVGYTMDIDTKTLTIRKLEGNK